MNAIWGQLDRLFLALGIVLAFGICASFATIGFIGWFKCVKRARLVEDLATSTIRAAAQGYIEVTGRQFPVPGHECNAPLTGTPCTWWRYKVEEMRRSVSDGGRRTDIIEIERATSTEPILLKDATGQLTVDPKGAEVEPSVTVTWFGNEAAPPRPMVISKLRSGRFRYTEERMRVGDRIYVAGEFGTAPCRSRQDLFSPAVGELLGRWKHDQPKLLQRFDTDGNGRIDATEWEAARDAAKAAVATRLNTAAVQAGQNNALHKPSDGQPFLMSAKSQSDLAKKLRADARTGLFLMALGVGGVIWMLYHAGLVM